MKIALISTVYNEGDNILAWAKALGAQTLRPDEFVIVDGGSTDGTPEQLRHAFAGGTFPEPRIIVERCNIARGRNLAIQNTTAEIIAATDAGSVASPDWLAEIIRPLQADATVDVCGGASGRVLENDFQRYVAGIDPEPLAPPYGKDCYPSSRSIAFRRQAWADVGGYPEWLTLAAEDALFNHELHWIGKKFFSNPQALVKWAARDAAGYYKMLKGYGFGAAEARLYAPYFRWRLLLTLCPPLLLLSHHRFKHFGFRYRKNAASATGWVAGFWRGRRAPAGWRRVRGVLLSPEAQRCLESPAMKR
ncbi:MAG: glycosyltransferase [Verrucomicrobiae bacterium]|nr:glycosyltransferase [Verrucomicrobiae bacterium]